MKQVALCNQFTFDLDDFRSDSSADETERQRPRASNLQTVGNCRNLQWSCTGGGRKAGNPVVGCM